MDCPKTRCDTEAALKLPDDPLVEILSRVPVKSVCRFKCVSKGWRDLIANPLHRKKLPQTLEGFFFTGVEHPGGGDDNGDGEHGGSDGSDDEKPPRQLYGFVDVLQSSVRPVDFTYLSELPGPGILQETRLLHCCNGLLLFAVQCNRYIAENYAVCNPATKQCVAVPSSGFTWEQMTFGGPAFTYLLFDSGVSCHFNLVQFYVEGCKTSVHVYSSKTQAWIHNNSDWGGYHIAPNSPGVYFNGMLHLLSHRGKDQLTVVDVEGNIQKIIPAPCQVGRDIWPLSGYIGQSQGCLYYICRELEAIQDGFHDPKRILGRLLIWALQDYDRQHWVLKDSDWDRKLVSYNMDSKEVCDLCTLGHGCKSIVDLFTRGHGYKHITPYVPYFSEFGA